MVVFRLAGLLLISALCSCSYRFHRMAQLPDRLEEASGLYVQDADTYWLHNDSGGRPTLYAVDPSGTMRDSIQIAGAGNQDWEDLSHDDQGHLYIFDSGNNLNQRQDLKVYKWDLAAQKLETIAYAYPDQAAFPPADRAQWGFDAEGAFWFGDSLYLFSKDYLPNQRYQTRLYVLPDDAGQYAAVLKDSMILNRRVVTAAAISPDGKRVALLSYLFRRRKIIPKARGSVFLLENFPGTDFLKGSIRQLNIPRIGLGRQFEAIDFLDQRTLIIGAEKTKIHQARLFRLRLRKD
jgi:hypothetical protein